MSTIVHIQGIHNIQRWSKEPAITQTDLQVIKPFFPCKSQLIIAFILLTNVKVPIIVGILTFISRINTIL